MANQIFGRCTRFCSTYMRIMVTYGRPSIPLQFRYIHGWDADDDNKSKKKKAEMQRVDKALNSLTMNEEDSQIHAKNNNFQQYGKSKPRNNESNYSALRVHSSRSGDEEPDTSDPVKGNIKNISKTLQGKYESDERNEETEKASNNANSIKDNKIDDKGFKRESSIDFIKIIRGQCDEIEKLSSKLENAMISVDKISKLPKKNETKPLKTSAGTGKKKLSPKDYLATKTKMNKDRLESIKIFGGIPEAVETARKARNSKISQRKSEKPLGKIQSKQPTAKDNKSDHVGKIIKKQLKSKEIKKSFDLVYVTQKDIDKWKKMESKAIKKGKPIAMSVDMIPQNHISISYDTMGLRKAHTLKNKPALNLNKKPLDRNAKGTSFTFEQIIAMTDKKEIKKIIETRKEKENKSMKEKGAVSFNKSKGTISDKATREMKAAKDLKENVFKETATSDSVKEVTHYKIEKPASVLPDKDPQKDRETKSCIDYSTKPSEDNLYKSTINEFTRNPVDLTQKPLRGTVAVLLEAFYKNRNEAQSNLANWPKEEYQKNTENTPQEHYQNDRGAPNPLNPLKSGNEASEMLENSASPKTPQEHYQNDKGPPNPVTPLKSGNEASEMLENTASPKSNATERSAEEFYKYFNPYVNTEWALHQMISKISGRKNNANSMKIQSGTSDTKLPQSFNATDAISEIKKKIKSNSNIAASKESNPNENKKSPESLMTTSDTTPRMSINLKALPADSQNTSNSKLKYSESSVPNKPSQFTASDFNRKLNVDFSEIKSECDLTPGDLYNTKHETVTCDKYAFEEFPNVDIDRFKLDRDILPERKEDKKETEIDDASTEPVSHLKINKISPEQKETDDNKSDFTVLEPYNNTEMIEKYMKEFPHPSPFANDNTIQVDNDNTENTFESNLTFAELFTKKLKELDDLQKDNQDQQINGSDNLNEILKAKNSENEAKLEQPSSINAKDNLNETPKENKVENQAKSDQPNSINANETPKVEKSETKENLKSDKPGDSKKTFTEYLLQLVTRNHKNPGDRRDFGTYAPAQLFSSLATSRYWRKR